MRLGPCLEVAYAVIKRLCDGNPGVAIGTPKGGEPIELPPKGRF
jgi:hypothetical protein